MLPRGLVPVRRFLIIILILIVLLLVFSTAGVSNRRIPQFP